MDQIWLTSPSPALRLAAAQIDGGWRVNPAAQAWADSLGPNVSPWPAIVSELRVALPAAREGRLAHWPLRWWAVALEPGWLVWFDALPGAQGSRDSAGIGATVFGLSVDEAAEAAEAAKADGGERARARHHVDLHLERALTLAKVTVWRIDLARQRLYFSAFGYAFLGLPPTTDGIALAELHGHAHPDDAPKVRRAIERAIASSEVIDTEVRFRGVEGLYRPFVTRRVAERDARGRAIGLIGVTIDQSAQAADRERAERAMRASQAKSEFLARASHELRTPLNAVLGFAQLIEHDGLRAPPSLQLERVAHIRSAGEHLLTLVDDVLDLAAIEAGNLPVTTVPVAIDVVLGEVAQWLGSLAQRAGVTIEVERCGGWVQADARRLRQIVTNVLSNAIKFNHRGGRVWLSAAAVGDAAEPGWRLSVRDNGRGLTPAQQTHLFEAFQRLGAERDGIDGIGLGLTIVRQLAELMGGHVDVVSAAGLGSEFGVTLRTACPLPAAPLQPQPQPQPEARPLLTVQYIEDNPVNVLLVEGLVALRPAVALRCAVDGLSGVAMACAAPPQVLLIDMQLPDIDGFEVLRRLRAEADLAGTRMVALSANAQTDDIARALGAGFDDYWTKPIDFALFLAHLDQMIAARA